MKIYPKLILIFLVVSLIFPAEIYAAKRKKASSQKGASCRAVILSNATKGKRLFGKNPNLRVLPASTAKVMTALVVLEKLSLDEYVTVSLRATYVQPSKIHLVPGERYKVRDLLYAILLNSANDASVVLAEAVAGSETQFVRLMNQRARQLGAKNTRFANSNGLPGGKKTQYTTAFDMYLIFRKAIERAFFKNAIKYRYRIIHSSAGRKIVLKSHNKMLFNDWSKKIYGKTGYTRAAQGCFVGSFEHAGSIIIIGVFGCSDRWKVIESVVRRYAGVNL